MPYAVPPLSPEDLAIIHDEVEQLFIHGHRKDLHLNTADDPTFKRETRIEPPLLRNFIGYLEDKVVEIFIQQTLLPANKSLKEVSLHDNPAYSIHPIVRYEALNATLENVSITFKLLEGKGIRMESYKTATNATTTCQKTAETKQCEFKNLTVDASQCPSCTNATVDFTLRSAQDRQLKPPVSLVALKLDGKDFNFELLCRSDGRSQKSYEPIRYICTHHDAWLIGEAFAQMLTDQNSPVYSDYFNPVAIIRYMLKKLGYEQQ